MMNQSPVVLLVLDGWGHASPSNCNAITEAPAHNFLNWWENSPRSLLSASGKEVGLPLGLMGNSEVGHTNIGAGRVVRQTISRIDHAIASGDFVRNAALRGAIQHALDNNARLHLFGLVGSGGVHASDTHYFSLLQLASEMGLPSNDIFFHALLDGRDTPPYSANFFLDDLEETLNQYGGCLASICGRFFGMDRDSRWNRTQRFWNLVIHGEGHCARSIGEALSAARSRGESDEFVEPTLVGARAYEGKIRDNDAVVGFNFRADRVRQFTEALLAEKFAQFDRGFKPKIHLATMTQYRADFDCSVAFPPIEMHSMFGELVALKGLRQFRCAETEKYAHVTFFFNGGRESEYKGEDRFLVPSPQVATYDLCPEMSAQSVTDAVIARLRRGEHHLYVVNFANADMVGHTGVQSAAKEAVGFVDICLKRIVDEVYAQGGVTAITADHGNSEQMVDLVTNEIHTAHTLNPVPFLLLGEGLEGVRLKNRGVLADVAPTLMKIMGIEQPNIMDGCSLL